MTEQLLDAMPAEDRAALERIMVDPIAFIGEMLDKGEDNLTESDHEHLESAGFIAAVSALMNAGLPYELAWDQVDRPGATVTITRDDTGTVSVAIAFGDDT